MNCNRTYKLFNWKKFLIFNKKNPPRLFKDFDNEISSFSADLATYITRFQWDMAKYPTKQSLRNIADIISKQTGQIEADLKTKSAAYNSLKGNLQNLEKKQT